MSTLPAADAPPLEALPLALPSTTLRVGAAGAGELAIIVPATISLVEDWEAMTRFLGRRFRAVFFELPGHGGSSAYKEPFSSRLVAQTVVELADAFQAETFTLVGFSFGGLLALRTLQAAKVRVKRVALLSPFVGNTALKRSAAETAMLRATVAALEPEFARRGMLAVLRNPATVAVVDWYMRTVGGFETSADLSARLRGFLASTLDVFLAQVREVLTTPFEDLAGPFDVPCLFGMSRHDPLLDFASTQRFVREQFSWVSEVVWDWPYHAPPKPLTLADYDRDHRALLDFDRA
ncbi:MAG: alpha/beta hydrolase [Coriobacteriia bacterium]|nr:alpha/beta hydrolase [Coriobacteriia bacterium]